MTQNREQHLLSAFLILILVSLWGCMLIYSCRAMGENPLRFAEKQLLWTVAGCAVFLASALLPFRWWKKASLPLLILIQLCLAAVLVYGQKVNGMTGWFSLRGWMFQPSEFAKVFLLLYLVSVEKKTLSRFLIPALICCGLVLLEPDFGTAVLLFAVYLIAAYLSGIRLRLLFGSLLFPAAAGGIFLWLHPYALRRILSYLARSGDTWHLQQFRTALARGGIAGSDSGAVWANGYLPLPHTDSLYAAMVESSGLIGGLIVLILFPAMVYFLGKKAAKMEQSSAVFLFSAGTLCAVQALLHISVNVLLLPATGITLPFLSYGGSSLISVMLLFGIAVSAVRSGFQREDIENPTQKGLS